MAQAVTCRVQTAEHLGRPHTSPCGICGGYSGNGERFYPSTSVSLCQYYFTNDPYLFIISTM